MFTANIIYHLKDCYGVNALLRPVHNSVPSPATTTMLRKMSVNIQTAATYQFVEFCQLCTDGCIQEPIRRHGVFSSDWIKRSGRFP